MLLLLVLKIIVLGTDFLENNNTPVHTPTEGKCFDKYKIV